MTKRRWSRRAFIKTTGTAGVGSVLVPGLAVGAVPDHCDRRWAAAPGQVPKRSFGRSGIEVSVLSLGGMFDIPNNQLMLQQALRLGVTYWDTANSYGYGSSEEGIGQFLSLIHI